MSKTSRFSIAARTLRQIIVIAAMIGSVIASAQRVAPHLYLCRSPLLAYSLWNSVEEVRQKGVNITPAIVEGLCAHMQAGGPQCIRVEGADFSPIATGWNGSLAMSDGKTRIWFHDPDSGGWIDTHQYLLYLDMKKTRAGE